MWFESQYQFVDAPLDATARRVVNPYVDGVFAIDGFIDGTPFKRVNYVQLTFLTTPGQSVCTLTVRDVSTMTDAIAALDDDVLNFILSAGVRGIRALVHIQEA